MEVATTSAVNAAVEVAAAGEVAMAELAAVVTMEVAVASLLTSHNPTSAGGCPGSRVTIQVRLLSRLAGPSRLAVARPPLTSCAPPRRTPRSS